MSLRRFVFAAAGVAVSLGFLPRIVVAQKSDAPSLFAVQRKNSRETLAAFPQIKARRIDEVMKMHLEGTDLIVETPLEPDREYDQKRAELAGFSEPAMVLCWLISQDLGQVQFEIKVDDYTDPGIYGQLHLQARPEGTDGQKLGSIQIEKSWQTPTGYRRVFFTQVNSIARLIISVDDPGTKEFVNVNLVEKDFATLRQKHRAETEQWMRPILRELHQEAAFAADPGAAWQVLADDWPVDNSVLPDVAEQIKLLEDDDFHVRQHAADALEKIGRDGALALMRMSRGKLTAEQNVRIDEVISRFKPLHPVDAKRLADDPDFLLDCLYNDDATIARLAFQRLTHLTSQPIKLDLAAPFDQRVRAVNEMREKLFANAKKP